MANLSTHYKEREPEQTVEIIKNFFHSNGLIDKLFEDIVHQSEAGTWYCHIDLFYNNIRLGGANGKGITKEYALASGYAELYERFCSAFFAVNPYWYKTIIDYNNKHFGYNLCENEKILTPEKQLKQISTFSNFFKTLTNNDNLIIDIINYITDNKVIGLPYKKINGEGEIYIDPRIAFHVYRTVGMAAGNTETEALVQGLSEIAEKQAYAAVLNNIDNTLYALELDKIENPQLQEIICKIKDCGYDLYLFDLSYLYGYPTIMSFIINRETGITCTNFGSFPVFDIAAERVLTELYQGIFSYNNDMILSSARIPYKLFKEPDYMFNTNGNGIDGSVMPINFLQHIEYKDTFNHDVFLDKDCNNEDCLKYFCDLYNKMNVQLYFINNTIIPDMAAVQIIYEGNLRYTGLEGFVLGMHDTLNNSALRKLMKHYSIIFNNIYNSECDLLNLLDLFNSQEQLDNLIGLDNKQIIFLWNYLSITANNRSSFYSLMPILQFNGNIQSVPNEIIYTPFFKEYKKFLLLQIYIGTKKYTNEECLEIFNKHLNFDITIEDINNIYNKSYLIQKAYMEPMIRYIHSDEYKNLIKIFIDKVPSY